jgi:hypothetical protein
MLTKYLEHKHGGRITEISAVGHDTYKKVAEWFYIGTVKWSDGTQSADLRIAPWAVCYDHANPEARFEYDHMSDVLNEHLREKGKWHERTPRGNWTPTEKTGRTEII